MKTTFEELQTFITIVDAGSITAAAQILNQTTSGVSRTLKRLEQKLYVTLLERTTRRFLLTQEGIYFLDKAREIIGKLQEVEENVQQSRQTPAGRLRISAPFPFVKHVILPLLPEFYRQFPDIILELNSDDTIVDLLENQIDVAIRIAELKDSTLHARILMQSQLHIVASPAYLAQFGIPKTVNDLNQHHLLGFSKNSNLNYWPILFKQNQFSVSQAKILASSGEIIRELAISGQGVACLSNFMISKALRSGALIPLFEDQILKQFQVIYAVYYKQNHLSARIKCFIDFLAKSESVMKSSHKI